MPDARFPKTGEVAPDFELVDSTGAPRRLSQLVADAPVVLLFYRGYWRPFCLRQLVDYRKRYEKIRAAGAKLAAISVDPPEKAEAVRKGLRLPFPILCDTERRVVQAWNICKIRRNRSVVMPAVFIVGQDRAVRFHSIDVDSARVPAAEIVRILRTNEGAKPARRKLYLPHPADWFRALRNAIRFGVRSQTT